MKVQHQWKWWSLTTIQSLHSLIGCGRASYWAKWSSHKLFSWCFRLPEWKAWAMVWRGFMTYHESCLTSSTNYACYNHTAMLNQEIPGQLNRMQMVKGHYHACIIWRKKITAAVCTILHILCLSFARCSCDYNVQVTIAVTITHTTSRVHGWWWGYMILHYTATIAIKIIIMFNTKSNVRCAIATPAI